MEYFFDYACPFCFVSFFQLLPYKNRIIRPIVFRPAEVHPQPEKTADFRKEPSWWPEITARGGRLHAPIRYQGPMPRTHLAIAQFFYQQEKKQDIWRYHQLIFKAVFQEGIPIDDQSVFGELLQENGFQQFWADGGGDDYLAAVEKANRYAYEEKQIQAFPTVIQGKQRIESLVGKGIASEIWAGAIRKWLL